MLHYQISEAIDRPVSEVFSCFIDSTSTPEWADGIEEAWSLTEKPVGVGSQMKEIVKLGGRRSEVTWEITAFERDRLCTWQADHNAVGRTIVSYTFDTSGDGTLVTADVRSQLRGFLRLAQPIARYISLRQRRAYLAKAKEILETGPQAR